MVRLRERRIQDLLADHPGDIVLAIAEMIAAMRASLPTWEGAASPVGIGVPAIVREDGSLRRGLRSGIPGGTALRERLSQYLGAEVVVDNDASLAALGEALFGAGQGERHIALLTLGTNIGMGVVVDGRVYRGARGAAGEIGTVPVRLAPSESLRWEVIGARRRRDPHGSRPAQGYVWLEELYGGEALMDTWRARSLAGAGQDAASTGRVLQLAAAGDLVAGELVREAVDGWALAIATTGNVLDPGIVLIAGGMAADIGPHLDSLRRAVEGLMPGRSPRIDIASLGPLAGLMGAAAAARAASVTAPSGPGPGRREGA
jgi:predicted NBD/HSP70 family sugar kinase